jgi:hypothetical protein
MEIISCLPKKCCIHSREKSERRWPFKDLEIQLTRNTAPFLTEGTQSKKQSKTSKRAERWHSGKWIWNMFWIDILYTECYLCKRRIDWQTDLYTAAFCCSLMFVVTTGLACGWTAVNGFTSVIMTVEVLQQTVNPSVLRRQTMENSLHNPCRSHRYCERSHRFLWLFTSASRRLIQIKTHTWCL